MFFLPYMKQGLYELLSFINFPSVLNSRCNLISIQNQKFYLKNSIFTKVYESFQFSFVTPLCNNAVEKHSFGFLREKKTINKRRVKINFI